MIERSFSGTPFDIGFQMGELYACQRVRFERVPDEDLLHRQLAFYERHAPEIIDEIRGIAAGGHYAFDAIAQRQIAEEPRLIARLGPMMSKKSCSIGGMTDNTGTSWVVRNYDWRSVIEDHVQMWKLSYPDGRRLAVVSDMGIMAPQTAGPAYQYFCPDDAINNDGLWIGLIFAYCWTTQIGLTSADALRLAAMRCATVDEALAFFDEHPLCCAKHYVIADKQGHFAGVQHAATDYDILRPDADGILAVTNHYQGRLAAQDQIPDILPHSASFDRETQLRADLRALKESRKTIDFDRLDHLMTRPGTPVCQCFAEDDIATVYTLLANQTMQRHRLIAAPRHVTRKVVDFKVA
jgi:hypothetical protein